MEGRRSQMTVDFMIALAILMLVLMSFFMIFDKRKNEFDGKADEFEAKAIAEKVAIAINDLHIAGSGATQQVPLPDGTGRLTGYELHIYQESRQVQIVYDGRFYSFPIVTSNINNASFESGLINIQNVGGMIHAS